jgi:hypothetical protein
MTAFEVSPMLLVEQLDKRSDKSLSRATLDLLSSSERSVLAKLATLAKFDARDLELAGLEVDKQGYLNLELSPLVRNAGAKKLALTREVVDELLRGDIDNLDAFSRSWLARKHPEDERLFHRLVIDPKAAIDELDAALGLALDGLDLERAQVLLRLADTVPHATQAALADPLQDVLRQRRAQFDARNLWAWHAFNSRAYVGREKLDKLVERLLDPNEPQWLHQLIAPGGYGKTYFLRHLIGWQLAAKSVPVVHVDFDFLEHAEQVVAEPGRLLLLAATQLDRQLPGQPFLTLSLQREHAATQRSRSGRARAPSEQTTMSAAVRAAESSFAPVLHDAIGERVVIFILDTLEHAIHSRLDIAPLLGALAVLHGRVPHTRVLLAGRIDLRELVRELDPVLARKVFANAPVIDLGKFKPDGVQQLLAQHGVERPKRFAKKATHVTGGVPLKVAILADWLRKNPTVEPKALDDFKDFDLIYLLERVLARIDPRVQWLLLLGALARLLDRELIEKVMPPLLTELANEGRLDQALAGLEAKRPRAPELSAANQPPRLYPRDSVPTKTDELWRLTTAYVAEATWISTVPERPGLLRLHPEVVAPLRQIVPADVAMRFHREAAARWRERATFQPDIAWAQVAWHVLHEQGVERAWAEAAEPSLRGAIARELVRSQLDSGPDTISAKLVSRASAASAMRACLHADAADRSRATRRHVDRMLSWLEAQNLHDAEFAILYRLEWSRAGNVEDIAARLRQLEWHLDLPTSLESDERIDAWLLVGEFGPEEGCDAALDNVAEAGLAPDDPRCQRLHAIRVERHERAGRLPQAASAAELALVACRATQFEAMWRERLVELEIRLGREWAAWHRSGPTWDPAHLRSALALGRLPPLDSVDSSRRPHELRVEEALARLDVEAAAEQLAHDLGNSVEDQVLALRIAWVALLDVGHLRVVQGLFDRGQFAPQLALDWRLLELHTAHVGGRGNEREIERELEVLLIEILARPSSPSRIQTIIRALALPSELLHDTQREELTGALMIDLRAINDRGWRLALLTGLDRVEAGSLIMSRGPLSHGDLGIRPEDYESLQFEPILTQLRLAHVERVLGQFDKARRRLSEPPTHRPALVLRWLRIRAALRMSFTDSSYKLGKNFDAVPNSTAPCLRMELLLAEASTAPPAEARDLLEWIRKDGTFRRVLSHQQARWYLRHADILDPGDPKASEYRLAAGALLRQAGHYTEAMRLLATAEIRTIDDTREIGITVDEQTQQWRLQLSEMGTLVDEIREPFVVRPMLKLDYEQLVEALLDLELPRWSHAMERFVGGKPHETIRLSIRDRRAAPLPWEYFLRRRQGLGSAMVRGDDGLVHYRDVAIDTIVAVDSFADIRMESELPRYWRARERVIEGDFWQLERLLDSSQSVVLHIRGPLVTAGDQVALGMREGDRVFTPEELVRVLPSHPTIVILQSLPAESRFEAVHQQLLRTAFAHDLYSERGERDLTVIVPLMDFGGVAGISIGHVCAQLESGVPLFDLVRALPGHAGRPLATTVFSNAPTRRLKVKWD